MNRADKLTGNQIVQLYIQAFEIRMENKDAASEQTNDDYSPSDYTGRPDSVSGKAARMVRRLSHEHRKAEDAMSTLDEREVQWVVAPEFYRHRYEGGQRMTIEYIATNKLEVLPEHYKREVYDLRRRLVSEFYCTRAKMPTIAVCA